jgi:uncharacterized protein (DUF433 family)
MVDAATLTPREVAELSGAPKRIVEKAIEEQVLRVRCRAVRGPGRHVRMLPAHAVAYAALMTKLDLKLSKAHKRRLLSRIARLRPEQVRNARIELARAVELDVGRLVGDVMERAEHYRLSRDKWIVIDESILGGTPVIRGTRITVYSVLGRVEHGETIGELASDNPDIPREAFETAVIYARTHPLMGRPGGRPWVSAA